LTGWRIDIHSDGGQSATSDGPSPTEGAVG
jgi:hypothetical protein